MLRLYFLLSFRNLKRQKLYALLNLAGLTVGLLFFLMIIVYVQQELSFDQFHGKSKRIYRLFDTKPRNVAITPYVWGASLKEDILEIEDYTTVQPISVNIKKGDEVYSEPNTFAADSTFFHVFDFPVIQGKKETLLQAGNQMVITTEVAKKYFGTQNPIGQQLEVNLYGTFEICLK